MNMWKGKDKMFKEFVKKPKHTIDDLLYIIEILRGPNGCPWDREQNHRSIRNNFIEETYEAVEAIDKEDPELLKEELGDVLLQVVFHSRMEQEANVFDFSDVCDEVCKKLILRHPHVFSDFDAKTSDAVLDNWEKIKQKTKGQKLQADTLLSVPKVFPALIRSEKVQKRAARAGFNYPDIKMAFEDLKSEYDELYEAVLKNDSESCFEELGDLLFAVVNVSRFLAICPEQSLQASTEKFIKRFSLVEELANQKGIDMKNSDIDVLNDLWEEAKKK